LKPFLLRLY